jgi:hypothetical protein
MALHPLKYKVSARWVDDEVYDQYGIRIKTPNPDPMVTVLQGLWRKKEGDLEKFQMTASEFRALTGIIVYGGDIEKRGITKTLVPESIHRRIQARWLKGEEPDQPIGTGSRIVSKKKASQLRLERAKNGTPFNKDIPIRVRKKK